MERKKRHERERVREAFKDPSEDRYLRYLTGVFRLASLVSAFVIACTDSVWLVKCRCRFCSR